MKFQKIFTFFFVLAINRVEGLPRNGLTRNPLYKKARQSLTSKAGLMPQRFCTHQNCRNCHQGLHTLFADPSSLNRVCKLLIISPKCCYEDMWNTGQFFWAYLQIVTRQLCLQHFIFNQTASNDPIYYEYFVQ